MSLGNWFNYRQAVSEFEDGNTNLRVTVFLTVKESSTWSLVPEVITSNTGVASSLYLQEL